MINTINRDTLSLFAYTNEEICKKPVKGIVLDFHGLNFYDLIHEHTDYSKFFAEHGLLYIFPYYGPWSWMNRTAVCTVDAIMDAAFDKYSFDEGMPIISSGGSMGGLSALIYTRYAKRTPVACAANCPVCDLVYHYSERTDLPRTIYSAFSGYAMPFEDAVKTASPIHQVANMPYIPYFIAHCTEDKAVNMQKHSDIFVDMMRKTNHDVEYITVPGRGHCDLSEESWVKYKNFILSFAR